MSEQANKRAKRSEEDERLAASARKHGGLNHDKVVLADDDDDDDDDGWEDVGEAQDVSKGLKQPAHKSSRGVRFQLDPQQEERQQQREQAQEGQQQDQAQEEEQLDPWFSWADQVTRLSFRESVLCVRVHVLCVCVCLSVCVISNNRLLLKP